LAAESRLLGLEPMSNEVAIRALASAMGPGSGVQSLVVAADWPLLAATCRVRGSFHMLDELLADENLDTATVPAAEIREILRKCRRPDRRRDMLVEHIGSVTASVMGMPPSQSLAPSTNFIQLGMNSLMSVLLQRTLSQTLGETLPPSLVFDYPTIEAVGDYLATLLPELMQATDQHIADAHENPTEADLLRPSERLGAPQ
jgi:acyl carrier protein